jgi:DNA-binding transcriptional LysR family regulator
MRLELEHTGGRREHCTVEARIASNSQVALQHMCQQGLGIARLARADVAPLLQRGLLVPVLAAWRPAGLPVWAVTPRRDSEEAKVRAALSYLKRHFAALEGTNGALQP